MNSIFLCEFLSSKVWFNEYLTKSKTEKDVEFSWWRFEIKRLSTIQMIDSSMMAARHYNLYHQTIYFSA